MGGNTDTMSRPITKLDSIENTAIKLFALKGIKQVTIKEIAKDAGCSEGALYRHYNSKGEMAWALYKREVEKFGSMVQEIFKSTGSYSERLKAAIELFYTFFDEDPVKFTFILLSQYNFPIEMTVIPDLSPYSLLFTFIEEGVKAQEFRIMDFKLGGAMILGIILQPATLNAWGRFEGPLRNKTNEVFRACLKVLDAENQRVVK